MKEKEDEGDNDEGEKEKELGVEEDLLQINQQIAQTKARYLFTKKNKMKKVIDR